MTNRDEIDKALTQLSMSGELGVAAAAIEALVAGLEEAVHTMTFRQLNGDRGLGEGEALNAWVELYAYKRIRQRLTQALKMGQSASETMQPVWEDQTKGE